MSKPDLIVVSFSGAHGTGKTTLLSDVRSRIVKKLTAKRVFTTPSVSTRQFERIRDKTINLPPGHVIRPTDYESIDKLHLRQWFQELLPQSLCFEVELALMGLSERRAMRSPVVLLLDRWFPDIYGYAKVENPSGARTVVRKCSDGYEMLQAHLTSLATRVRFVSVFVPLSASNFPIEGQAEKFRGTCDRDTLEAACLDGWPQILPTLPSVTISTSDRVGRVAEVMGAVEEAMTAFRSPRTKTRT